MLMHCASRPLSQFAKLPSKIYQVEKIIPPAWRIAHQKYMWLDFFKFIPVLQSL